MNKKKFKYFISIIFMFLFIGISSLAFFTYSKLEIESLLAIRESSDELIYQIESSLENFLNKENSRTFYSYHPNNDIENSRRFNQRSKLSQHFNNEDGIIGHFQVEDGQFSAPFYLKFEKYKDEIQRKTKFDNLVNALKKLDISSKLIPSNYAENIKNDLLAIKNSLPLTKSNLNHFLKKEPTKVAYIGKKKKTLSKKSYRKKKKVFKRTKISYEKGNFIPLVSKDGQILFLRKIIREKRNYLQGFLVQGEILFQSIFVQNFQSKYISDYSSMQLRFGKNIIFQEGNHWNDSSYFITQGLGYFVPGMILDIIVNNIPKSDSLKFMVLLVIVIYLIVSAAFYGIYRVGINQIELAEQRANFVSAVGHELKTPLTSISMYSEMLQDGMVNTEKKKQNYYTYIFMEAGRLTRLINNILKLSKINKNRLNPEFEVLSSEKLIHGLEAKVKPLLENKGFTIKKIQIDKLNLHLDRDLMMQIFINVIDNSIKFSKDAKKKQIDLSMIKIGESAKLIIRDYGKGIDKGEEQKVFEIFYRSENELTRTTIGTGIGLALVDQLSKSMGGKCFFNHCNKGVEFCLIFDLA